MEQILEKVKGKEEKGAEDNQDIIRPDATITRRIWDGQIPLKIVLDEREIRHSIPTTTSTSTSTRSDNNTLAFFTMAHRCSYLPLLSNTVRKFFLERVDIDTSANTEIWYEFHGIPLKWHYPIGLLFDYYNHHPRIPEAALNLPWTITVRFRDFPATRLLRIPASISMDAPHDFFMALIKEADFIKNGSSRKIMALTKQEQIQLWEALLTHNHNRFWEINTRLMSFNKTSNLPRNIPLRLYCIKPDSPLDKIQVVQDLVPPLLSSTGNYQTLQSALQLMLNNQPLTRCVLHGVEPPGETPLLHLYVNFSYPDNFLHIVVLLK